MMKEDDDRGAHSLISQVENVDYAEVVSNEDEDGSQKGKVVRRLTFVDGVAIVVGIIIGSGIFSSPGLALERSGSPGMDLIAWALSGVLVTLAAQCYLELGGMMPSAGGDFDYLGRAYGDRMAFSFAWFNFFVSKTGSQAIIATIFGRYFESVVMGTTSDLKDGSGNESVTSKLLAVSLVVFITLLNCAGIKESAVLSIVLTSTKVLLVLLVFIFAVAYAASSSSRAETFNHNLGIKHAFDGSRGIFQFGTSMVACLWCYDGFADGNFLLEEMINPVRDLPRIIRVGLFIVTTCYILTNIGYLTVLESDTIIDTKAIAVQYGETVSDMFKSGHGVLPTIFALGVSLSTIGSMNGSVMTGGRAFFAVARAGKFPSPLAKLNSRGSPYYALIAQGCWSIVLLLIPGSNFSTLLDYFGPTSWLFYGFSASSIIALRHWEPDTARPFKVPLYPLPPILVMGIALVIFISSLIESPFFTLLAIGFVLLSVPVYYLLEQYGYIKTNQGSTTHDKQVVTSAIHQSISMEET